MALQDLLNISSEQEFKDTCRNYLTYIGSGVGRDVYRLNSKQVIKIARCDMGYSQNASECDTYNAYVGLGIFNEITKHAKGYLWVIQPLATPLKKDDARFEQIAELVKHIESSKEYSTNDEFLKKLYGFLIDTEWKYLQDIRKHDSWGIVNGELRLIDYGMNNEAYNSTLNK